MRVRELLLASGATEVRTARDDAERLRFWQGRKAAFPAVGRISPDYYCMDGTIPRRALPEVLRRTAELSEEYGLPVANVFHAGDGNMHPLILYDANKPGELERTEELGGRILELCVEVGGTITGEHGVGIEKIRQMCVQFSPSELDQFTAVKLAFDPLGLLNPGKGVPTPRRCSEYRQLPDRGLTRLVAFATRRGTPRGGPACLGTTSDVTARIASNPSRAVFWPCDVFLPLHRTHPGGPMRTLVPHYFALAPRRCSTCPGPALAAGTWLMILPLLLVRPVLAADLTIAAAADLKFAMAEVVEHFRPPPRRQGRGDLRLLRQVLHPDRQRRPLRPLLLGRHRLPEGARGRRV
jgi:hypothetical protein